MATPIEPTSPIPYDTMRITWLTQDTAVSTQSQVITSTREVSPKPRTCSDYYVVFICLLIGCLVILFAIVFRIRN
jgi:hypothetical protein